MLPQASELRIQPWCPDFSHIVFSDSIRQGRQRINVAPAPIVNQADASLSTEEAQFLGELFSAGGVSLADYRTRPLRRRLAACLRALHATSVPAARQALQQSPRLLETALSATIIGTTWFFRDVAPFEALRRKVIPDLMQGRQRLAAWCVGCSDGAELYSLAMSLAGADVLGRWRLLGTDCRHDAVQRAREGIFRATMAEGVPDDLRARYLSDHGNDVHVAAEIRAAVEWRTVDAVAIQEPGPWDLILCRNMLMYLTDSAARSLCRNLEEALRPGGMMMLGKAERPVGTRHLSAIGPCLYRRDKG